MKFTPVACLVLVWGPCVFAQAIQLRGTVKSEAGQPIAGATVALDSKQLKATTDASGAYALSGGTIGVLDRDLLSSPIDFRKGVVHARLAQPGKVKIEWMDLSGALLDRIERDAQAGSFSFDATGYASHASLVLVRVSVGSQSSTFQMIRTEAGATPLVTSSTSRTAAGRAAATVDSLKVSATGYTTKTVPLSSYESTVDVTLASALATCNPADNLPNPVTVNVNLGGSPLTGSHQVVVETDPGLSGRTIFRPKDLGPGKKYPILVWGNGACARNSTETADYYAEIASHGYIVINEGTPGGTGGYDMGSGLGTLGGYLIKAFDWMIQQNAKPCSRFYQSLDTAKIGAFGWSCGGLMAYGASMDPRVDATIIMNSGLLSADQATLNKLHAPIAYVCGGSSDMAYVNGQRDYNGVGHLPTVFANVTSAGHGGTYWADNGGEFAKFAVAWFNWWLKGDTGATGRLKFVAGSCSFCSGPWSAMPSKKL